MIAIELHSTAHGCVGALGFLGSHSKKNSSGTGHRCFLNGSHHAPPVWRFSDRVLMELNVAFGVLDHLGTKPHFIMANSRSPVSCLRRTIGWNESGVML
jgi:hypothetical protein